VARCKASTVTDRLPLPVRGTAGTCSHVAVLVGVHAQSEALAVTLSTNVPPLAGIDGAVGENVKEQVTPDCDTATVCPPMVMVALRCAAVGLGCTVTEAVEAPEPRAMEIQGTGLEDVHAQSDALAVTVTDLVAPLAESESDAGDTL
jgi:hypothetical protein